MDVAFMVNEVITLIKVIKIQDYSSIIVIIVIIKILNFFFLKKI